MTKNRIGIVLSVITVSTLMLGCGSSSATQTEPVEIEATQQADTNTTTLAMNGAVVAHDVVITATTQDNKNDSTVTVPAGTKFTDKDGKALDSVTPTLALTQDKSENTQNTSLTKKVQTKIKLTDDKGNQIVPSEPITAKVKAPGNAKPGDKVSVSIPDDATKADGQKKLVIFIVDADGYISVKLFPAVFKKKTVILIIIEKVTQTTGGEGGN